MVVEEFPAKPTEPLLVHRPWASGHGMHTLVGVQRWVKWFCRYKVFPVPDRLPFQTIFYLLAAYHVHSTSETSA